MMLPRDYIEELLAFHIVPEDINDEAQRVFSSLSIYEASRPSTLSTTRGGAMSQFPKTPFSERMDKIAEETEDEKSTPVSQQSTVHPYAWHIPTDEAIKRLAEAVHTKDWHLLANKLGFTQSALSKIEQRNPTDKKKQVEMTLKVWRKKSGDEAYNEYLAQALKGASMADHIPLLYAEFEEPDVVSQQSTEHPYAWHKPTDAAIQRLAEAVHVKDWYILANKLGFSGPALSKIEQKFPHDKKKQVEIMLKYWRKRSGDEAYNEYLAQALKEAAMKEHVPLLYEDLTGDDQSIDNPNALEIPTSEVLAQIAEGVGDRDWHPLAAKFGFQGGPIKKIEDKYPGDKREQIVRMLKFWRKKQGEEAYSYIVEDALKDAGLEDLVPLLYFKVDEGDIKEEIRDVPDTPYHSTPGIVNPYAKEIPTSEVLIQIAEAIRDKNWQKVAHELGFSDPALNKIRQKYPEDKLEQVVKMLKFWRKRRGEEAFNEILEEALLECGFPEAVSLLYFKVESDDVKDEGTVVNAVDTEIDDNAPTDEESDEEIDGPQIPTNEELDAIADAIADKNWYPLATVLGFSMAAMDKIRKKYPGNSKAQAVKTLNLWKKKRGETAYSEVLEDALIESGLEHAAGLLDIDDYDTYDDTGDETYGETGDETYGETGDEAYGETGEEIYDETEIEFDTADETADENQDNFTKAKTPKTQPRNLAKEKTFVEGRSTPTSDMLKQIAMATAGRDWHLLAKELGFAPAAIQKIENKYPADKVEQCYVMLKFWRKKRGNEAYSEVLKEALKEIGYEDVLGLLTYDIGTEEINEDEDTGFWVSKKLFVRRNYKPETPKSHFGMRVPTNEVIAQVSEHIGERDWRSLAALLGFGEKVVDKIADKFPGDNSKQVTSMLKLWIKKRGESEATTETLEDALTACGMEDVVASSYPKVLYV